MAPVWMAFRAELRDRWRAWAGLGLLIGIAAGFVIAAAAGARRTDTAYQRFLREQRAFDAVVFPECPGPEDLAPREDPSECDVTKARSLPSVREAAVVASLPVDVYIPGGLSLDPGGDSGYTGVGEASTLGPSTDGRFGTVINRMHIVEGRLPDPDAPDEVAISTVLAERRGIEVGDTLRTSRLERASGDEDAPPLPDLTFRVVGIEISPFEIEPPSGEYLAVVHVTAAAIREAKQLGADFQEGLAVRLRKGDDGVAQLRNELETQRIRGAVVFRQADQAKAITRAIDPEVAAAAIIAMVVGLAVLATFGSVLGRQAWAASGGFPTMWSLGLRRRQLVGLTVVRGAAVAVIAATAAVLVAIALSPLTPVGLARQAEPDPGVAVDGLIIPVGFVATLAIVVLLVAWPAWRIARASSMTRRADTLDRSSRIARAASASPLSPAAVTGVRMALDPGRGSTAVPVRSSFFGVIASVVALVAALGFSSGLERLVSTPRLLGFSWDGIVFAEEDNPEDPSDDDVPPLAVRSAARALERLPEVEGATVGVFIFGRPFPDGRPLELGPDRLGVELLVMDPGPVKPVVIDGRAPLRPREIVLGTETLDELGLEIGDRVRAFGQAGDTGGADAYQDTEVSMRVVGTAAIPWFTGAPDTAGRGGRGAVVTVAGLRLLNPVFRAGVLFVKYSDGTPSAEGFAALRRATRGQRAFVFRGDPRAFAFGDAPSDEQEVLAIERVNELPLILAGLVGVLAAVVLLHLLVTSVRTRRRDFAVLRALGFRRRDLRAVVTWQALTITVVALVIGLPVGALVGGRIWELYAASIGVLPEAAIPVLGGAIVLIGGLLVTRAVSAWPGRVAAHTQATEVLRAE